MEIFDVKENYDIAATMGSDEFRPNQQIGKYFITHVLHTQKLSATI